jgi:hypothetical protein
MDANQIAESRKAFEDLVKQECKFLDNQLGFDKAEVSSNPDEFINRVSYQHEEKALQVDIVNAYSDFDCGFEISLHDLSSPGSHGKIVYHKPIADQDDEFAFVVNGIFTLRTELINLFQPK